MSSSDDDFIEFLEQESGYSRIVSTFRFTLLVLFAALLCSVTYYVYTYVRLQGGAKSQDKFLLISFEFLFLYGLFAALASALDTISYARYRSRFLSARKDKHGDGALHSERPEDRNKSQMQQIPAVTAEGQTIDDGKD
jgi:hypothetical protein